jgi:DNA-binding NarL/FixJ family response regulator
MAKIKVLLIEDNRLLREGTTAMLNKQEDIRAVPASGNGTALAVARKLVPDVVLLDLGLKSHSSLKVLESIKNLFPRTEVIVMDLIPAHSDVVEFLDVGVSGFIPKDSTLDDFLHTIRSVVKGVKVLPPTTADSLLTQIVEQSVQGGKVGRVIAAVKFTKREQEVISLLAQGTSVLETSIKLKITAFAVKSHIRNITDKLALRTRLEPAALGRPKNPTKSVSRRGRKKSG